MRHLVPLVLVVVVSLTQALSPGAIAGLKQSNEMQQFLEERLVGKHDLRIEGLTKVPWTWQHFDQFRKDTDFETYQVPYPKFVADHFRYEVLRLGNTNEFLIIKTGGIAGVFQIYSSSPERNSR